MARSLRKAKTTASDGLQGVRDGNQNLLGRDEGLRDTAAQVEITERHLFTAALKPSPSREIAMLCGKW